MREIKFRAWDKQDIRWVEEAKVSFFNDGYTVNGYSGASFELLQFTGLLDKNGKEIYEGDIIRIGHYTHELFWKHDEEGEKREIGWFLRPLDDQNQKLQRLMDEPRWNEVIGNIYENPELIKK